MLGVVRGLVVAAFCAAVFYGCAVVVVVIPGARGEDDAVCAFVFGAEDTCERM